MNQRKKDYKKAIEVGIIHDMPTDLKEILITKPDVLEKWNQLTPLARNE